MNESLLVLSGALWLAGGLVYGYGVFLHSRGLRQRIYFLEEYVDILKKTLQEDTDEYMKAMRVVDAAVKWREALRRWGEQPGDDPKQRLANAEQELMVQTTIWVKTQEDEEMENEQNYERAGTIATEKTASIHLQAGPQRDP